MKAPEYKDEAKALAINTACEMMKLNMTQGAKVCLENFVVTHPDGVDESCKCLSGPCMMIKLVSVNCSRI